MIIIMVRWKHLPRSDACSRRQRPHLRHLLHHHLQVVNVVIIIIIIFITIFITIYRLSSSSLGQAGLRKAGPRVTLLIGNCHRGTMLAFMLFQFCAKKAAPKISSPKVCTLWATSILVLVSLCSFNSLLRQTDRQTLWHYKYIVIFIIVFCNIFGKILSLSSSSLYESNGPPYQNTNVT